MHAPIKDPSSDRHSRIDHISRPGLGANVGTNTTTAHVCCTVVVPVAGSVRLQLTKKPCRPKTHTLPNTSAQNRAQPAGTDHTKCTVFIHFFTFPFAYPCTSTSPKAVPLLRPSTPPRNIHPPSLSFPVPKSAHVRPPNPPLPPLSPSSLVPAPTRRACTQPPRIFRHGSEYWRQRNTNTTRLVHVCTNKHPAFAQGQKLSIPRISFPEGRLCRICK